jgi:hypothetical protein
MNTELKTQKQVKEYINSNLSKEMIKRIRPQIHTNSYRRRDGNFITVNVPTFINIDIDSKFEITENEITYSIKNNCVCVTIWKESKVSAHVTVYSKR